MLVPMDEIGSMNAGAGGDEKIGGEESETFRPRAPGQVVGGFPNWFGCFQIVDIAAHFLEPRKFLRLGARP